MNTIDNYEQTEHLILTKLFSKNALTSRLNPIDLNIEYKNKIVIGEFKQRNKYNHTQFDWILEAKKYKSMLNKYNNLLNKGKDIIIYYINYFKKDDMILIWDLSKRDLKNPVKRLMNAATAQGFNNSGEKVLKCVFLLDPETAKYKFSLKTITSK